MSKTKDATSWQKQHEKQVQLNQNNYKKIEMIKALRSLSRLLGKLGFQQFKRDNPNYYSHIAINAIPRPRPPWSTEKYSYGLGLKESKDLVEAYLDRKAFAASAAALSIGIVKSESDPV
jgi:hypothetical protein